MKQSPLNGLVLAGGRSSRMGSDKGLIQYHAMPQREYLFHLLHKFCQQVFTSCRKEQNVPAAFNPVYDKFDFESPLNGILSAFETNPKTNWLVVAVDMPNITEDVLTYLCTHRDDTKVATCFYDSDGKLPEPLLTIWEAPAFPLLQKFVQKGGISPREFLIANDCMKLTFPDARVHMNVNTPDDLQKLKT